MYDYLKIEKKWQNYWLKNKTFKVGIDNSKEKYYVLDMFPYPSGAGLHVGHPEGYTATDIVSRYKRMKGFNVLHPMGFDAFGLPAENYAIKTGTHPKETTQKNIKIFTEQLQAIGFSYDWDREIDTTDPEYFKWTQWIFLQLFNKGLAYEAETPINFCPSCKTGLANEEVVNGECDRCHSKVTRKTLRQWILKITDYADRLLEDLELVDWPEAIKTMQRNWIGKSEGVEIDFKIEGHSEVLNVFTTRLDTIFSGTYMIMAPEHKLIDKITTDKHKESVQEYIDETMKKSDMDRTELNKEKTGVFTGSYAINPANDEKMPIWISDFVLASYGCGAVFADAHDERDFEMAKKYDIPLKLSIRPKDEEFWEKVKNFEECFTDYGILINSEQFDGLDSKEAIIKICEWLEEKGLARKKINYKLRDWVFSRQRYWGEPIPLIHCDSCGTVPIPEEELPLLLPEVEKYEPSGTGESPLANIDEWVNTTCPKCGGNGKRETNTMPQWAGSCWYYLRYTDNENNNESWGEEAEKYFLGEKGVDLYVGGAEHAVLHLLYSRFWHKVLFDLGKVSQKEPFYKLKNQGMILGEDHEKMSKSRGNVINPGDVIEAFGADSLRLYEMFMGPFEAVKQWSTKGIQGVYRFLQKVWKVFEEKEIVEEDLTMDQKKLLHKTIKKITLDIENFKFNTAISQMMIFINEVSSFKTFPKEMAEKFILLLSTFSPHIGEELWEKIGYKNTLAYESWPEFNDEFTIDSNVEIVIQVNGKLRGSFDAGKNITKEEAILKAKGVENAKKYLGGVNVLKEIFVPGKLVNFVVKE